MRVYALVMLVAAVITFLATPVARRLAQLSGAVTAVRSRDVHIVPTPRLGGVAMCAGFAGAMVVASQIPFLEAVFASSEPWAILGGAAMVCLLGVADDIWDLDWMTKLVGQILAAGFIAWHGVQLITFPVAGLTIGSARLSLVATVLVIVVAMNAVNFVDGLDGLAAGMVAIGGIAFFVYTYELTRLESPGDYSNLATVVIAAVVGICAGFLPHNLNPARIFMGDSGSMLLGFTVAAAAITVTGQIDPATLSAGQAAPAFVPIILPLAVLLLPLLDMALSVSRRLRAGQSPFKADRMHLHHRLLAWGHSHRRVVAIMHLWTAYVSFAAAALVLVPATTVLIGAAIALPVVVALSLTGFPFVHRSRVHEESP